MKKIVIVGFMLLAWGKVFSQTIQPFKYPEQKAIIRVWQQDNFSNRVQDDDSVIVPDHETPDFHGRGCPPPDNPPLDRNTGNVVTRIESPAPCANFQGLNDNETNNTTTPPDVNGAVGPNYLMVTQNTGVKIQPKTGGVAQLRSLKSFFNALTPVAPFDPKVVYDPFENRWIVACADATTTLQSRLLVAVSQTSNPLDPWYYYWVWGHPSGSLWLDYPCIGFNKNWIVISGNMYNSANTQLNCAVFVFNKAAAYAGSVTPNRFEVNSTGSTLQPAITYDNTLNTVWLCNNYNSNTNNAGYLRLYTITGTPSAPGFTYTSLFPNSYPWSSASQTITTYQCSTGVLIGDSRIRSLIYQQGSLWAVQKIGLPTSSPNRVSVQWWEINPNTGGAYQCGRIDDLSGFNMYFNPSLAVNSNKDVLVGHSHYSPALLYPNAAYSFRTSTYTPNALEIWYDYKTSTRMDCRGRWGDYSATVVDPNGADLWTLQEYLPNGNGAGSWWAKVCLTPNCIPVHTITSPVTTSNIKYEASDHIIGSSLVNPPSGFVKFDAAKYVELNPGFSTQITNGFFTSYIDGCGGLRANQNYVSNKGISSESVNAGTADAANSQMGFSVYPNPANDLLYIHVPGKNEPVLQVSVWDALGKEVLVGRRLTYQSSIDISGISKGVYFIKVHTPMKEYKVSFVKQ